MESCKATDQLTVLALVDRPCVYHGYIKGYRQPVGCLCLQVQSFHEPCVESLRRALEAYFNGNTFHRNPILSDKDLIICLGEGISGIQKAAGFPIFEEILVEAVSEVDRTFKLWIPCLQEDCFHQATAFMLQFFLHNLASPAFYYQSGIADEIIELVNYLESYAPKGLNSLRLLETAYQHGIPWLHLAQNTFQLGHGCHSRWFDSTLTDKTPQISASIARNKYSTAKFLEKAGVPVPRQQIVLDGSDAVEKAREIGYPVVIKPNKEDGGRGVTSWLLTDDQVSKAFIKAQKFSETVLLEKHVVGKDYRLLVVNGTLVWAIERIPAGVSGDGESSIHQLINQTNRMRESGTNRSASLKPIRVNDDTYDFLADQGYTIDSIPAAGQFVQVSRVSNITSGGVPVSVFDCIHPDNKRLAETVVDSLRLDIAGVDFIMPDIRQSYHAVGGTVVEVNAQPQIGTVTAAHLYPFLLKTLIPKRGRIPVIVVCSDQSEDELIQKLHLQLSGRFHQIGLAKNNRAYLNGERIHSASSLYQTAQTLLINQAVDALIYCIRNLDDIDSEGLPFDQHNCLIFLGMPQSTEDQYLHKRRDSIRTLFSTCQGDRLISASTDKDLNKLGVAIDSPILFTREQIEIKIAQGSYSLPDT